LEAAGLVVVVVDKMVEVLVVGMAVGYGDGGGGDRGRGRGHGNHFSICDRVARAVQVVQWVPVGLGRPVIHNVRGLPSPHVRPSTHCVPWDPVHQVIQAILVVPVGQVVPVDSCSAEAAEEAEVVGSSAAVVFCRSHFVLAPVLELIGKRPAIWETRNPHSWHWLGQKPSLER